MILPGQVSNTYVLLVAGLLANDTNPCGSAAKIKVVTNPGHGSVTLSQNGGFTYRPNPTSDGLNVEDSFTYEITCPNGLVSHD